MNTLALGISLPEAKVMDGGFVVGSSASSARLRVMQVASVCHRNIVYRAVYQVGSTNLATLRFVAEVVPFVAKY
jgi:hypothetical protein